MSPNSSREIIEFARLTVDRGHALDALRSLDHAISQWPTEASAHATRGYALVALGRSEEALVSYEQAVRLAPDDTAVYVEVGQLMMRLGRPGNAHAAFRLRLGAMSRDPAALEGAALALVAMNRHAEALPLLEALRTVAPSLAYLSGRIFHSRLQCCDWRDYEAGRAELASSVRRGECADTPFTFLAHNESPADQRVCAQRFVRERATVTANSVVRIPDLDRMRRKIRLGYLSADFREHPVAQLIAPVLERHDRSRFEVVAFSSAGMDGSELRARVQGAVDEFNDVGGLQDAAIARSIAGREIDLLIDLGGHTAGSRTRVLGFRSAPVQIGFMGFPGTSGAPYVDYLVADANVIPSEQRAHYGERLIVMPDSYLPAESPAVPRSQAPCTASVSRVAAGLPATGTVYCSFNAAYKISPSIFQSWMRILRAVPGSILWLRQFEAVARENLGNAAERCGVARKRIIYAASMPNVADHFARLALADLFLDTYPYNAHTTAIDALGVGVPVVTLRGPTFAGRVATSLLASAELAELSCATLEDYERLAVDLGLSTERLSALKRRVSAARSRAPLFDLARFTQNLDAAFGEVHAIHLRGAAPCDVEVSKLSNSRV